jgi:hypothetical protein
VVVFGDDSAEAEEEAGSDATGFAEDSVAAGLLSLAAPVPDSAGLLSGEPLVAFGA